MVENENPWWWFYAGRERSCKTGAQDVMLQETLHRPSYDKVKPWENVFFLGFLAMAILLWRVSAPVSDDDCQNKLDKANGHSRKDATRMMHVLLHDVHHPIFTAVHCGLLRSCSSDQTLLFFISFSKISAWWGINDRSKSSLHMEVVSPIYNLNFSLNLGLSLICTSYHDQLHTYVSLHPRTL